MAGDLARKHRRRALAAALILGVAAVSIGRSTRLDEPPRFDGAGYVGLAKALASGRGYREVDHPDSPRHAHFPPGYPSALAALAKVRGGLTLPSAHLFSIACTLGAVAATWRWWLRMEPVDSACLLGFALAANWAWGRVGGAIQSEPLYLATSALALLLAGRVARRDGLAASLALGAVLGSCVLTRHVGACLALAVGIDLGLRGRGRAVAVAGTVAAAMVGPWIGWQARVGRGTQAGLFSGGSTPDRVAAQALFYARRIPDQVAGPFVEAATVFGRSPALALAATVGALAATSVVLSGWIRLLRVPRRRLGALIPLATLPLLLVWPFTEAGRFLIPLVPFLLMGAAEGLTPVFALLRARRPRRWASGLVLAASLPYAAYALATDRAGAQRRTHEPFDAACRWIAGQAGHPGPVLARHPGDVSWLAGRLAVPVPGPDPAAIAATIDRYGVAYLLVDEDRYASAPANPLSEYVAHHPDRARLAWRGGGRVAVYEARPVAVGEGFRP